MTVEVQTTEARSLKDRFSDESDQKKRQEVRDHLRLIGGGRLTEETGISYHDNGQEILVPRGMGLPKACKILNGAAASQAVENTYTKKFLYRPWDGAVALDSLLRELYGLGSQGKPIHTFFGTQPPHTIDVEVGVEVMSDGSTRAKTVSVPWGLIDFPDFEGELYTGQTLDPEYGLLFEVTIKCPRKYKAEVDGFWVVLEGFLKENSIYRGAAIVGVGRLGRDGNFEHPRFLDAEAIDPAKVAYRQEVFDRLKSSVWGPIETADLQRSAGMKLNRKTLLFGPYGTGKSLAGGLTARTAVDNGWTFIQCKTGDEDLNTVLKTAELYAPCVVFIEDIDILIESDPKKMSELLEQFDGVSSKNKEVMVLMTSNHVETLSKGMTRVGRIDAAIEIGSLDREAIARLIHATFTETMLSGDIDFEAIYEAMKGYEPAFIMGTFNLTKSNAIIRTGSLGFQLTTEDFVLAAETLRNQHDTHSNAADRPEADRFGESLRSVVAQATEATLQGHRVDFRENGDIISVSS
jgi:transitional endoplasmic reticulum ATPase